MPTANALAGPAVAGSYGQRRAVCGAVKLPVLSVSIAEEEVRGIGNAELPPQ